MVLPTTPPWSANVDVGVADEVIWGYIRDDGRVGAEDGFDIDVDKVVERVEVLLDQAFDFEESGKELPFILSSALSGSNPPPLF